jgi:hypothetical protein
MRTASTEPWITCCSSRPPRRCQGRGPERGEQLANLIDLPPTLLHAAGLPIPAEMQGRSLLPLVRGVGANWPGECSSRSAKHSQGGWCGRGAGDAAWRRRGRMAGNTPGAGAKRRPLSSRRPAGTGAEARISRRSLALEKGPPDVRQPLGKRASC